MAFGRIQQLRVVGWAEALSFLVLLGVAMPLKYLAGQAWAVRVVGAAHGALFVLYLVAVARAAIRGRWPAGRWALALAASVVPAGPILLDRRLHREEVAEAGPPGR